MKRKGNFKQRILLKISWGEGGKSSRSEIYGRELHEYLTKVCLFGVFRPTREFFTHMETSPLSLKGCKFWHMLDTYGSLACHTHCDTGQSFIMVIFEDSWHSHLLPSSGAVTACFYDLSLSQLGFKHPNSRLRGEHSNPLRHRRGPLRK